MPSQQLSKRSGMAPRRGRKQRGRTNISLNPVLITPNQRHTLAFADRRQLTEAALGTGCTYTYSLNGMYDPNITGVGAQPVGFDPLMTMYRRYRVVGARFQLTVVNRSQNSLTLGYALSDTNALPSTTLAWLVDPKSASFTIGGQSGGHNLKVIDRVVKPWNALTVSRTQYMSEFDYTGSAVANPAINLYLIVWAIGTTAVADIDLIAKLSYQTEFTGALLQSTS